MGPFYLSKLYHLGLMYVIKKWETGTHFHEQKHQVSNDYSRKGTGGKTAEFDIIEIDGQRQIVPTHSSNENSGNGRVRVQASLTYQRSNLGKVSPVRDRVSFTISSLNENALVDPVTNMPLRKIYIGADRQRNERKEGKQPPGIYEISTGCYSAETYVDEKEQRYSRKSAVKSKYVYGTDYTLNRNGSVGIKRENNTTIITDQHQHNLAIFQYVDSFIPKPPQPQVPQEGVRIPIRKT